MGKKKPIKKVKTLSRKALTRRLLVAERNADYMHEEMHKSLDSMIDANREMLGALVDAGRDYHAMRTDHEELKAQFERVLDLNNQLALEVAAIKESLGGDGK